MPSQSLVIIFTIISCLLDQTSAWITVGGNGDLTLLETTDIGTWSSDLSNQKDLSISGHMAVGDNQGSGKLAIKGNIDIVGDTASIKSTSDMKMEITGGSFVLNPPEGAQDASVMQAKVQEGIFSVQGTKEAHAKLSTKGGEFSLDTPADGSFSLYDHQRKASQIKITEESTVNVGMAEFLAEGLLLDYHSGTPQVKSGTTGVPPTVEGEGLVITSGCEVTGSGTYFTGTLHPGDMVRALVDGVSEDRSIVVVKSPSSLTISRPFSKNITSGTAYQFRKALFRARAADGTHAMLVEPSGRLGIGVVTPRADVDVAGSLRVHGQACVGEVNCRLANAATSTVQGISDGRDEWGDLLLTSDEKLSTILQATAATLRFETDISKSIVMETESVKIKGNTDGIAKLTMANARKSYTVSVAPTGQLDLSSPTGKPLSISDDGTITVRALGEGSDLNLLTLEQINLQAAEGVIVEPKFIMKNSAESPSKFTMETTDVGDFELTDDDGVAQLHIRHDGAIFLGQESNLDDMEIAANDFLKLQAGPVIDVENIHPLMASSLQFTTSSGVFGTEGYSFNTEHDGAFDLSSPKKRKLLQMGRRTVVGNEEGHSEHVRITSGPHDSVYLMGSGETIVTPAEQDQDAEVRFVPLSLSLYVCPQLTLHPLQLRPVRKEQHGALLRRAAHDHVLRGQVQPAVRQRRAHSERGQVGQHRYRDNPLRFRHL